MQDAKLEQADDNTMVIVGTDSFSMEELVDQLIQFDTKQKMYSISKVVMPSAITGRMTFFSGRI